MLWIILIVTIFLLGTILTCIILFSRVHKGKSHIAKILVALNEDRNKKMSLLSEVAQLLLGFSAKNELEVLQKNRVNLDEELRAERGRLTITQAELEAVETRLRELEEIAQELEASRVEAIQELEMLQTQERDFQEKNKSLRQELESSLSQLDQLLEELASSQEAVTRLKNAKAEFLEGQEKVSWYTDQIAVINQKYLELKKAYDALDIEYAQLYEKQNAA